MNSRYESALPDELQAAYATLRKSLPQLRCARHFGVSLSTLEKLDRGGRARNDAVARVVAILQALGDNREVAPGVSTW